ncbi:protein-arginine kinase [Clostridia bacterium]|nr:protein-arginine kinase [Clostridia bacterium]
MSQNFQKWYEREASDDGIIISSRVRLARNLKKHRFPARLEKEEAEAVVNELSDAFSLGPVFTVTRVADGTNADSLHKLVTHHLISPEFAAKKGERGYAVSPDEAVCVMINEEDHVRLQSICAGDDLEAAYSAADKADNFIEETVEYAFDADFGYLTACPTNAGTGMRASYMLHLPGITQTGGIAGISQAAGKFGMAVRGLHGEGSEPMGAVFQLSNQTTMGQSEADIIAATKSLTREIMERENAVKDKLLREMSALIDDKVFRSYGILANCRVLRLPEAMGLLSNVRMGYVWGRLTLPRPQKPVYQIMIEVQDVSDDVLRADYVREMFGVRNV